MKESKIVADILKYLTCPDGSAVAWKANDRATRGIPDIIAIVRGNVYFLEVKTPDGKASPIQEYVGSRITRAGGSWHIVRSVDDVKRIVSERANSR